MRSKHFRIEYHIPYKNSLRDAGQLRIPCNKKRVLFHSATNTHHAFDVFDAFGVTDTHRASETSEASGQHDANKPLEASVESARKAHRYIQHPQTTVHCMAAAHTIHIPDIRS